MTPLAQIHYRAGYKYQLVESHQHQLTFKPPRAVADPWVEIDANGLMTLRYGYAWDGPSGPTYDSPCFMRGPLIHDGGYGLLREGLLPEEYRALFDETMLAIILEDILLVHAPRDGDSWLTRFGRSTTMRALEGRAQAWYGAVKLAAAGAASQNALRTTYSAP